MNNVLNNLMGSLSKGVMPGEDSKWYHQFSYTEIYKFKDKDLINLAKNALFFKALSYNNSKVIECSFYTDPHSPPDVIKDLEQVKVRIVYQTEDVSGTISSVFGVTDFGAVYVTFDEDIGDEYICVSSSKEEILTLSNFTDEKILSLKKK